MAQDRAQEAEGKSVAEILALIGWGRYHTMLFVVCGLGWLADAVETGLLSFLKQQLTGSVDEFWLASLQYMVFAGEFLGCFVWGPLADRMGRRWAFLFANAGLTIFGLASAFAPHFAWLVVLRFLVGCCIGGIVIPFDMLLEFTEERFKESVLYAINYWWTIGTLFINVAASMTLRLDLGGFETWRLLCIVAAVPVLLAALGFFVMEESPLWLHEVGRNDEAMAVLQHIARKSGKSIEGVSLRSNSHVQAPPSMLEVLRQPYRLRTAVYAVIWFLGLLGYYGASLADPFIFEDAPGEVDYVLVVFSACGEFLGIFLFQIVSKRQGYLWTTSMSFAASAVVIFLIFLKFALVPKALLGVIVFGARAGVMASSVGFYVATPNSYPTRIRCTAHSYVNLFGRAGGFFATLCGSLPMAAQLGMFGAANVICSGLMVVFRGELVASVEDCSVYDESLNASFAKKSFLDRSTTDSNAQMTADALVANEA